VKPRSQATTSRANRAALTLVRDEFCAAGTPTPREAQAAPRVSLANPLPPPSRAALEAARRAALPDYGTGVRLRSLRKSEVAAFPVAAEAIRAATPRRPHVTPPPPPTLPYRRRNSRDPTDPNIEILAIYRIPPIPLPARNRDPWVEVCAGWIEDLSDLAPTRAMDTALEVPPCDLPPPIVGRSRAVVWSMALIAGAYNLSWFGVAADGSSAPKTRGYLRR